MASEDKDADSSSLQGGAEEYVRHSIQVSLGVLVPDRSLRLQLLASEDHLHRLQDRVFALEEDLRAAARRIDQMMEESAMNAEEKEAMSTACNHLSAHSAKLEKECTLYKRDLERTMQSCDELARENAEIRARLNDNVRNITALTEEVQALQKDKENLRVNLNKAEEEVNQADSSAGKEARTQEVKTKRAQDKDEFLWLTIASSSSSSGAVPGHVLDSDHLFRDKPTEAVVPHCDAYLTSPPPDYHKRCIIDHDAYSWDSYCSLFGVSANGEVADQSPNLWYLDSGATNHMTAHKELFEKFERFNGSVRFGDGSNVHIEGMGSILLKGNNGKPYMLSEVYFVPRLRTNVISIGQLTITRNIVLFEDNHVAVLLDRNLIMNVKRGKNRLYPVILKVVSSAADDTGQQEAAAHDDLGVVVTPGLTPVGSPGQGPW